MFFLMYYYCCSCFIPSRSCGYEFSDSTSNSPGFIEWSLKVIVIQNFDPVVSEFVRIGRVVHLPRFAIRCTQSLYLDYLLRTNTNTNSFGREHIELSIVWSWSRCRCRLAKVVVVLCVVLGCPCRFVLSSRRLVYLSSDYCWGIFEDIRRCFVLLSWSFMKESERLRRRTGWSFESSAMPTIDVIYLHPPLSRTKKRSSSSCSFISFPFQRICF